MQTDREMEQTIHNLLQGFAPMLCQLSHDIWEHPEIAFEEQYAFKRIQGVLQDQGFSIVDCVAGLPTAFYATYGTQGPVIAFLGEYDALPSLSQCAGQTQPNPIQAGGAGHGCGHNVLGAGALGGALALKAYLQQHHLAGRVRYYGCPAEENGSGKMRMVTAGAFDDVDIALAWHPDTKNGVLTMGQLANASYVFSFQGKTAHAAAAPEMGRSGLDACELTNVGANYLREHVVSTARFHYAYLNTGGTAPNVVPDTASVNYFIRAPKTEQVRGIAKRLKDVARGAALMTGTTLEIIPRFGMCDFVCSDAVGTVLAQALERVGAPQFDDHDRGLAQTFYQCLDTANVQSDLNDLAQYVEDGDVRPYEDCVLMEDVFAYCKTTHCKMGSSDVGDVSYVVPTAWLSVATVAFGTPFHHYLATAQMATSIADKALLCAGETLALAGALLLAQPEQIAKAKEELKQKTGGKHLSPISQEDEEV